MLWLEHRVWERGSTLRPEAVKESQADGEDFFPPCKVDGKTLRHLAMIGEVMGRGWASTPHTDTGCSISPASMTPCRGFRLQETRQVKESGPELRVGGSGDWNSGHTGKSQDAKTHRRVSEDIGISHPAGHANMIILCL